MTLNPRIALRLHFYAKLNNVKATIIAEMKPHGEYSQILFIFLIATAIGITMNVVRSNSLPWFAKEIETVAADAAELDLLLENSSETMALRSVTLQQAYEFFKTGDDRPCF